MQCNVIYGHLSVYKTTVVVDKVVSTKGKYGHFNQVWLILFRGYYFRLINPNDREEEVRVTEKRKSRRAIY